jgi:vacuolar iron transporter family protein
MAQQQQDGSAVVVDHNDDDDESNNDVEVGTGSRTASSAAVAVVAVDDADAAVVNGEATTTAAEKEEEEDVEVVTAAVPPATELPPLAPLSASQHLGSNRQYWRDIILGVNDGLVSTFLLVAGVVGGGLTTTDVLLTALAGAIAGAVSMCAGEYVATKSQNEVLRGEIALERHHVHHYLEEELGELHGHLLDRIGITAEHAALKHELVAFYRAHPDALLQIMSVLEFGVVEEQMRSPLAAGLTSCLLFMTGALPSVLPFCFANTTPMFGLILSALLTTAALVLVGAVKTWASRGNCMTSALENLIIAGFGGGLAYGIGLMFDKLLR